MAGEIRNDVHLRRQQWKIRGPRDAHSTMKAWMLLLSSALSRPTNCFLVRTVAAATSSKSSARHSIARMSTTSSYDELVSKLQQISFLEQSSAVLNYDQMVSMPDGAATSRGNQMAALAEVVHEKSTSSALKALIDQTLQNLDALDVEQQTVVKLAKEDFDKKSCIPAALEARRAKLSATANVAWVKARQTNDFEGFADTLKDCFEVCRETAECQRKDETKSLYSVLLDEFEKGMSKDRIDEIFGTIEASLVPLLQKVLASQTKVSTDCLKGTFDVAKQQELSKAVVEKMGFDTNRGRIDTSVHPFTSSFSNNDVRITSRFRNDEWYQGLAASIHEGGHALYEQNLGGTSLPIDSALSMGTHESQSLFWERHVGLSKPFWKWMAPQLQEKLGITATPDELYRAVNAISPGLIRVEADELTYPLHVILRYKIERDIIEGKLEIKDLPSVWNRAMLDNLGVEVPTDTEGCLQDVHWCSLAIGYFPTYLIGSATAAQLFHYCQIDIPDIEDRIEQGNFGDIKQWLVNKIHKHGKRHPSLDALLEHQLGEPLNPKYFLAYLTTKYSELYDLE